MSASASSRSRSAPFSSGPRFPSLNGGWPRICSIQGKNGVSAHEIHRTIGVTYKTAWFMMHRLREAMTDLQRRPMGGKGKIRSIRRNLLRQHLQACEGLPQGSLAIRRALLRLIEKPSTVAFAPSTLNTQRQKPSVTFSCAMSAANQNYTLTKAVSLRKVGKEFAAHKTVEHGWNQSGFYVGKDGQTTNAVENFFGNFKRSMKGTYRFCSEQHLAAVSLGI